MQRPTTNKKPPGMTQRSRKETIMLDFPIIDGLRDKLNTLRPLNAGELKSLRDEFVIDNTYNSNAIKEAP